ncbi:muconate cycloisomerase [Vibrio variabilis]|uniref:Muconate cycloisomerase n=1 Tax=Vibrio variabilis TaxID=990271 RepID=A0ABQ0J6L9_9VIBR|nr:muconate cycloisomerase [Vibrio variabilis]
MKITGWRSLTTIHRWSRPVGDINGIVTSGETEVPILILETDCGVNGVGLGAHGDIERLFPAIDGEDPRAVSALYDRMHRWVFKSGHCGSAFGTIGVLDMALWDLKAKLAEQPLWRLLGGRDSSVPCYASGLDYGLDHNELLGLHDQFVDRGFTSFKLKGGLDIEHDLERLSSLYELYQKNCKSPAIMIDVNEAMNPKQAIRYAKAIEKYFELSWIEEPVRRWDAEGHALVRNQSNCAVATGENLTGIEQFLPLLKHGSADILQAGMCWGISHFIRLSHLAHAYGLPVSPVSYNANPVAHATTAIPNHISCEVQDLSFPEGLTVDQTIENGGINLGKQHGLGISIDEAAISQLASAGWSSPKGPHVRSDRAGLSLKSQFSHSHSVNKV